MLALLPSLCFGALLLGPLDQARAMPRTMQELSRIQDEVYSTGLIHGDIPSLSSPTFLPIREASLNLEPDDPVFVVPLPSGVRIYPQRVMVWHEVINELIQGTPYCITYCPISGSLAVYSSRVNNLNLIFDAEGRLYNNNAVLIDRNTGSLWSQILGMAFEGPLMGSGMNIQPCYWTTWQYARQVFPDASVMQTPRGGMRSYGRDPYGSYLSPGNYYDDDRIFYPLSYLDSRLPPKTQVIGLEVENNLIGIDVNYVKEHKVVNFYAGLVPLVALHDSRMDVVRIYSREIWDGHTPALFALDDNGYIRDIQTRSLWSMDGVCLDGNLTGASMQELFGIYAFWFAWAASNPESELVPGNTVVPDSALIMGQDFYN